MSFYQTHTSPIPNVWIVKAKNKIPNIWIVKAKIKILWQAVT